MLNQEYQNISEPPPRKKWLLHLPRPKVADSKRADLALSRFQHVVGCFNFNVSSKKLGSSSEMRAKHSNKLRCNPQQLESFCVFAIKSAYAIKII